MGSDPFVLVRDPDDDVEVLRGVRALNDPAGGRLAFEVLHSNHATAVALTVLRALGKRSTISAAHEGYGRTRAQALAWLLAWNIREIFVLRSHKTPKTVGLLRDLCLQAGARMWLVVQQAELPTALTDLLDNHGGQELPLASLPEPCPAPQPGVLPARRRFPIVPRCHFLMLDHYCARLLSADDQTRVITERDTAAKAARQHLAAQHNQSHWALTPAAADLERRFGLDPDPNRVAARLYGLQLACFEHRCLTPLDPHIAAGAQPAAGLFDPAVASALHEYSDTQRPAYAVWTAIGRYQAPPNTRVWGQQVTLADVAADGRRVAALDIPEHLAIFVRAHRNYRLMSAARSDDPYFVAATKPGPLGSGMKRKLLAEVALDTGIDTRHGARIQTGYIGHGIRNDLQKL